MVPVVLYKQPDPTRPQQWRIYDQICFRRVDQICLQNLAQPGMSHFFFFFDKQFTWDMALHLVGHTTKKKKKKSKVILLYCRRPYISALEIGRSFWGFFSLQKKIFIIRYWSVRWAIQKTLCFKLCPWLL